MKEDIEYIFNTLNEMKIEDSEKFISAVSNMFFDYKKLEKENTDLKELYIRIAKHFEKEGHIELSKHMLAQIEATPYFTTWEEYTTWVSKDKIREKINKLEREKQFLEDNKMKDKMVYTPYQIVNAQILRLEELLEEE